MREGHDFRTQDELTAEKLPLQRANPIVMQLVLDTLQDMEMLAITGQLPGGQSYSDLPAWKVALYRAYGTA